MFENKIKVTMMVKLEFSSCFIIELMRSAKFSFKYTALPIKREL
jgi:hypothetical protein